MCLTVRVVVKDLVWLITVRRPSAPVSLGVLTNRQMQIYNILITSTDIKMYKLTVTLNLFKTQNISLSRSLSFHTYLYLNKAVYVFSNLLYIFCFKTTIFLIVYTTDGRGDIRKQSGDYNLLWINSLTIKLFSVLSGFIASVAAKNVFFLQNRWKKVWLFSKSHNCCVKSTWIGELSSITYQWRHVCNYFPW